MPAVINGRFKRLVEVKRIANAATKKWSLTKFDHQKKEYVDSQCMLNLFTVVPRALMSSISLFCMACARRNWVSLVHSYASFNMKLVVCLGLLFARIVTDRGTARTPGEAKVRSASVA